MKYALKRLVAWFLMVAARGVIRRYRPKIVMITGSVGKTSTKDAVAAVLAPHYFVRKSDKSFNSDFGVPFTIFNAENPWGRPLAWIKVIKNALTYLLLPNHYPNMLVLEVGADRPGDLARILKIATPDAVVVTRLPEIPVHVEAYASPEAVREEEFSPAYALAPGAPLVISADDETSVDNAVRTSATITTYGVEDGAHVQIANIDYAMEHDRVIGMKGTLKTRGGETLPIIVSGSVGDTQLFPIAAGVALGEALGISPSMSAQALREYVPPPGRGRMLDGINGSVILDDTYNASPAAVERALATLASFPAKGRKIAVLGDMLELGRYSAMEHDRIGVIARKSADHVYAVGVRSRAYAGAHTDPKVTLFSTSVEAAATLPHDIKPGDVILVKGSQSIRMERVVEALLANKADVAELVRQEPAWKRKA